MMTDFTGEKGPSIGSITNWKNEAYRIVSKNIEELKKKIIKVIHTDETLVNVNGNKYYYAIGCFTKNMSIIEGFKNRRKKSFVEMGILTKYKNKNINVSDHYSVYYSYGKYQNVECNIHIIRELKSIIENTGRKEEKEFEELLMNTKKEVERTEEEKVREERHEQIREKNKNILKKKEGWKKD